MWILTSEYNQYDQEGSYFEDAWDHKPTREELLENEMVGERDIDHLLAGGGRRNYEHVWLNLFSYKENYD